MPAPTTLSRSIRKLLEVVHVASRAEKRPGFSSALGLTSDFFHQQASHDPPTLSYDDANQTLNVQVSLSDQLLLPQRSLISLSTYLAMMDDITTYALMLADPQRARAGVSVSLSAEWAHDSVSRQSTNVEYSMVGRLPGDVVQISAQVRKVGRNLGFCSCEIRHVPSGSLICFGSHIKYLPMGAVMDFLQSQRGWKLAQLYAEYGISKPQHETTTLPLSAIFDSFDFNRGTSRGSFQVTPAHASHGGPIHGGCQAVLMELAATSALQDCTKSEPVVPDPLFISVDYLSSPSPKQVELAVRSPGEDIVVQPNEPATISSSPVALRVELSSNHRTSSEGLLHFDRFSGSTARSKL